MSQDKLELIRKAAPSVLPSLLLCDFGDLKGELARLEDAGAEVLHLDVMDGNFVGNLTYGMPIVDGIRRHSDLPMDVHLMINDPLSYAKPMVDAGADLLTFHVEAVEDALAVAGGIKDLGVGVGVALNPDTPLSAIESCLDVVDMVLVMSVKAGFGGQKFNPVALEKLRTLKQSHPELLLEIDGGIDSETIGPARAAGCDLFVVGSAIFKKDDYKSAIADLDAAMSGAV
ncbi:ribulose-phosphate 3-epimerase [Rhodopirellula sp. MGV]|uniref:ribulose-phosphate 3-epimerase n=1 Tax=Rhodopirellula sp. MGV TaxID=2023130 RepID=UPI000B966858|nr:ribulose-phosphate 3-epimerase [Rhodopirellula sp. MGV]OYP38393.1 ribulose-phosphate 3-epimerase [Rhodopirellula sp. MGV]